MPRNGPGGIHSEECYNYMRTNRAKFFIDISAPHPCAHIQNTRWRIAGRLATYTIIIGRLTPGTQLSLNHSCKKENPKGCFLFPAGAF